VGTRSVIARPIPEGGFYGTYCHYDGYPAHQGRVLFDAVTGHFPGDTDAACSSLIDQHPAGWSVLHGDFTTPPGYQHPTGRAGGPAAGGPALHRPVRQQSGRVRPREAERAAGSDARPQTGRQCHEYKWAA
jgi:hypothetical protein